MGSPWGEGLQAEGLITAGDYWHVATSLNVNKSISVASGRHPTLASQSVWFLHLGGVRALGRRNERLTCSYGISKALGLLGTICCFADFRPWAANLRSHRSEIHQRRKSICKRSVLN